MTSRTKAKPTKDAENSVEVELKDIEDSFESMNVVEKGVKKQRRYKKKPVTLTLEDLTSTENIRRLAMEIVKANKEEVKPTINKRIVMEVFNIEKDTLFTARHFSEKLKISFTAVYKLMDELQEEGKIKTLVMHNGRKYYTSVENDSEEYIV